MTRAFGLALAYVAIGLTVGFAAASFWSDSESPATNPGSVPVGNEMGRRISSLEVEIAAAADLRNALSVDIAELRDQMLMLQAQLDGEAILTRDNTELPNTRISEQDLAEALVANGGIPRIARERRRRADDVTLLTEAGFSQAEAEGIKRRLEEVRVSAMEARYESLRGGDDPAGGPLEQILDSDAVLREELGEADYERYLAALGRPTKVSVDAVLASSAAERAGLQIGDEIVSYGGERVFNVRDLNQVLLSGNAGEAVLLDIVRAGQPMQIAIPRGPLGITSNFGGRTRR